MKKGLIMFVVGLIIGVVLTILLIFAVAPGKMFIEKESKLGFQETVDAIVESATENRWSVSHQYDLQATMKKNGFEVAPVTVLSLCNPQYAHLVLEGTDDRVVSALMPCRVSVYEKNGKTYVSMLNAPIFSRFLGKKIDEVMSATTLENLKIIEPVLAAK